LDTLRSFLKVSAGKSGKWDCWYSCTAVHTRTYYH
jgi:hypothetical protein